MSCVATVTHGRSSFVPLSALYPPSLALQLARPKTMQGQWVTGRMLAGLAEAYVAAINAHAVPSIGNAWDGVTKVECAVSSAAVALLLPLRRCCRCAAAAVAPLLPLRRMGARFGRRCVLSQAVATATA